MFLSVGVPLEYRITLFLFYIKCMEEIIQDIFKGWGFLMNLWAIYHKLHMEM